MVRKVTFVFWTIVLSLFLCFVSCKENNGNLPAFALTVNEGFKNPIGFYSNEPSFSWKLPQTTQSQSAYSIVAASSPDFLPDNPDLWESGKIESDQSLFVVYEGPKLDSRQKVYWQVKYWDSNDEPSKWSEIAHLELGLLKNKDWKGKWVGLPTRNDSLVGAKKTIIHTPQHLRKSFEIPSDVVSARLYVTAKGVFSGQINGKKISDAVMSPGWTPYDKRIEALTYDVTDLVDAGENTIGFQVASGWHFGRMLWNKLIWGQSGSPKVLCQLEITFQDGSKKIIVSDDSWVGTTNGPIRFAEIYDGEIYDANFEMPNWSSNTFDATKWKTVEVANIEDSIKIQPKRHHSVKEKVALSAKKIIKPIDGSIIFDLKQNMVGVPKVKVPMKKGDTLKIRFSEMLAPDGSFYTDNYRSARSTDYYISATDGTITWTPKFTFHGFRYVELSGFDKSQEPKKDWVTGIVQYSDFESNGTFASSHEKLDQLQNNIVWGLRGNFFDIPTDCPQRDERLGWTGDAQVFASTSIFNADVHSFWKSWLQTLQESQFENGGIPFVAPDVLKDNRVSSGWGDAAVIIPWDIYYRTGDIEVLRKNYDMMKKWLAHHQNEAEDYISGMNSFGDWLQPYQAKESRKRGDTSKSLIGTAFFAHAAHLTSKAADVLNQAEDKEKYQNLYETVANAFENEFFDENGSVKNDHGTQTAYLLALNFELLSNKKEQKAKEHLIDKIKEADNHLRTGFLGTPLLPKVLDEMGEIDLMYEILFKETYPSWFYSINQGATTMWERWNSYSKDEGYNAESMNSLNHYAYGAVGEWMYERIAGIKPLQPGYKEIRIAPIPGGGLNSAEASYESPYGKIESSWKIDGGNFELKATVPPNTTAKIHIPIQNPKEMLVDGKQISANSSLSLINENPDSIELTALPGTYIFTAPYK
ncbi:family 78 glycoside hydrolase catalytic domain [Flagellimonas sp. 389]|uniref:family 78 glycoside hydrolase catalytic domain n=1 Tax=Flagellimonas sp. 389 TaxID=2835862 RepID=UPI001BD2BB6A|nr:family 78 glycoside hydrolase catalytic domain [Flagellimonas sp. 389]MBS9461867.1 family 78 glycoside hydrolase catalytic domain [Flagellimonas sp. 389]